MKTQILLLLGAVYSSLALDPRFSKSIEARPRVGYSTNVVHTFPGNLDNWAQTSINPYNQEPAANNQLIPNKPRSKFAPIYRDTPGNLLYGQNNKVFSNSGPHPNLNSFNVGYNIQFGQNGGSSQKYIFAAGQKNKNFDNAEIITGKLKGNEQVRAPIRFGTPAPRRPVITLTQEPQLLPSSVNYITNPLFSKYNKPARPATGYGKIPDFIRDLDASFQASPWKSIGTNIEMSKSIEGPQIQKTFFRPSFPQKAVTQTPLRSFNHEKAIRYSQPFDVSNVSPEKFFDNFQAGSEQYSQYSDLNGNRKNHPNIPENIDVNSHIPSHLRGVKPLPLDTSLLKDPVLTTDFKEAAKDSNILPIHFDLSPIQAAVQKESSRAVQPEHVQHENHNYESQNRNKQEFGARQKPKHH
ncbi:uncharacterized protein LOC115879031 isoform X2 [Sitophilus oryzae]|uniref:Uncharacterized protein LOC115879031 isoform X2 n=1 Tax=Sitophilus oryzae TaxID=7048 RepID=A0A6J2XK86_SITOR|nr:uncharacterized protein LOC115879031 isoform X2 [Sitophilus oryzae]